MKRASVALLLMIAFAASACGSTNHQTPGQVAGGDAVGAASSASAGPRTSADATTPTDTGAPATANSSSGSASNGSTGARDRGATGVDASGPIDASPLKVGFIVIKGGDALVTNSLGTPVSFGDGKKQIAALVKDLNKRGGIRGRPVAPVYYEWNVANTNDTPARGCVKLTEDDHVFAIITVVNVDQDMASCAAKHRTLLINASFGAGDRYMYDHFGEWFFSPSLLLQNIQKQLLLAHLRSSGQLGKGVKVGVAILGSDEQYKRVADTTIVPTLKAWKVPYETFAMTTDADVSGAVLRFRADKVTIVMFSSSSAIPPLLFLRQAESQGWRPNYAMTDSDDTNTLGQYAPRGQVSKIKGIGTQPISNVAVTEQPQSASEKRCLAIMRAGGENDTNRRTNLTAEPYCEALWDFAAVANKVTGTLTSDAFRAVFPRIGTSFAPVMTFSTDFGNGRHDNASSYRPLGWKTSCSCIGYTAPMLRVPRS